MNRARLLRLEAIVHLIAARLAVRLLPWSVLSRLFELPPGAPSSPARRASAPYVPVVSYAGRPG